MKKTLYIFLILIILGLSYFKWQARNDVSTDLSPSPSPLIETDSVPVRTLATPYFTLEYPLDATSSPVSESPDSQLWQLSHMGDKQKASGRTQTELFDGYAITITHFEGIGDEQEMTQAKTDRQGIIDACGATNTTEIKTQNFLGREAITFYGGCLGEANHYYFLERDTLYRITTMVVGAESDTQNYQNTVDKILASLKFIDPSSP